MASYLSYFTSGNTAQIPQQQQQQQAGHPSNSSTWSSTFSSRIATLRKALTKDSEEDDLENEDCSHVSNVLRAYYTEKGRPFPEWLPSDPKKPAAPVVQSQNQYGQYGGYVVAQYGGQTPHSRGSSGGRAGLSDLWDNSSAQPALPAMQSLRTARPTPQSLRSQDSNGSTGNTGATGGPPAQQHQSARPLPSQRAGSYQNTQSAATGGLGSRDRLRARLQGGGSGRSSPAPGPVMGGNYGRTTHSENGSYGTRGSGNTGSPFVSASQPWSSDSADYYGDNEGRGQQINNPRSGPGGRR